MKVFVINLKKDIEKRQKIEEQLKNLDLEYEIIEAINGKDLSNEELEKLVKDYKNCYLTKGEIGCALSHQKIYKKMIEEDIHHCLILEDNVIIDPETKEFLQEMDKFLQDKKDFICLAYGGYQYYKNRKIDISKKFTIFEVANPYRTHAYILTKNSAKQLLKINSPIILEADRWLIFKELSLIKLFTSKQNFIISNDDDKENSNIEKDRLIYKDKRDKYRKSLLKKNLKYLLNRFYLKFIFRLFVKIERNP